MSAPNLASWWQTAAAKFDALVLRERVLVALTLVAALWMVWDFALQVPIDKSRSDIANGLSNTKAKLAAAVQEQRLLSESTTKDPDILLRAEQQALQAELAVLETELREAIARFVAPQKMPALLAELMRQHQGLSFKRVTRLPSEPLAASISQELLATTAEVDPVDNSDAIDGGDIKPNPSLYRHPIELEFEGSYFDVLAYLAALEQSSWRLNWRSLEYQVDEYPLARVTIRLDTLSRRKEWLGV